MGEMGEQSQVRISSLIQAFVTQAYVRLLEDEDEQANAYMQRAQEMWDGYLRKTQGSEQRLRLTPLPEMKQQVLDLFLDTKTGLVPEARVRLRTKLGLPAEAPPAPANAKP
jgi:predicted ATP-dependent endonuclease of OLD family